jgi:hypothetical protein
MSLPVLPMLNALLPGVLEQLGQKTNKANPGGGTTIGGGLPLSTGERKAKGGYA